MLWASGGIRTFLGVQSARVTDMVMDPMNIQQHVVGRATLTGTEIA